jgi:uncharacterized protein
MNIELDCKSSPLSTVSALPFLMRIAGFVAGVLLVPGLCLAAGFDCNRATTLVEKLVCADEGLSQLDENLSKTYKEVLRWTRDPAGFKRDQVKWLREVRDLCTDGPCLEKEYRNRLAVLEKLLPEKSPADRQAHAASFDCGKAASEVEKIICGDDELSRLDESLNNAYLQALKRTDIKEQMIKSQRQWLKNERNACQNAECIKKAYETRIKELILSVRDGSDCGETPDLDLKQKGVTEYSHQRVIYHSIDGEMKGADSLTVWNRDARRMCFSITTVSDEYRTCCLEGKATAVSENEYSYTENKCRALFTFIRDKVKVKMIGSEGTNYCAGEDLGEDSGCGMNTSIDSATYRKTKKVLERGY